MTNQLQTIREAQHAVDEAKAAWLEAIRAARAAGVPVVAIAAELGITRQRVYQLLQS